MVCVFSNGVKLIPNASDQFPKNEHNTTVAKHSLTVIHV
jgi:hypothetical protein